MQEVATKKIVTKIEANPLLSKQNDENAILRVAAYCRVSTDSDDQIESYKAQVTHYTDVIQKNPKWRFVDIYADEGITGTMAKKRPNFLRMIRDCEKGKIDLILTKSVARFARNTVDSLKYVRQLKAKGIGVFFEEQNLDSLKSDSEMLIGFHSVMAQAESENISENVKWGIRQRMKFGTFKFRYNLLGYTKGEDGEPKIVPEEAETIRNIFQLFLNGYSVDQLKIYLESNNVATAQGGNIWNKKSIRNILTNERYAGDMLLQKTFTENCISKKVKKNRGELTKYLITNNHPAIIDRDTFKLVQLEISRRSSKRKTSDNTITQQGKYSGKFALTELLVCGECGSPYRRRTWVRNGEKKKVWRCLSRVEHGHTYCRHSITVEETKLQACIARGLNRAIKNQEGALNVILAGLSYAVTGSNETLDIFAMEQQIKELDREMDDIVRLRKQSENPQKYKEVISRLCSQMVALRNEIDLAKAKIAADQEASAEIERLKKIFTNTEISFSEYDDMSVRQVVRYIRVMPEDKIVIVLKSGLQIEESIEEGSNE